MNKKLKILISSILLYFLNTICVFADKDAPFTGEKGTQKLSEIIERIGNPSGKMIFSIVVIVVLIICSVLYYKKISSGGEKNGK